MSKLKKYNVTVHYHSGYSDEPPYEIEWATDTVCIQAKNIRAASMQAEKNFKDATVLSVVER